MRAVSLQHDWILHADMDEHHVYPLVPIKQFLAKIVRKKGSNAVGAYYRDRVTKFEIELYHCLFVSSHDPRSYNRYIFKHAYIYSSNYAVL